MNNAPRRILALAGHEYRSAARSRVLLIFVAILMTVTAVSVYIAAAEYAGQLADYQTYRDAAQANGLARIAPSPFAAMALLRGALEYLEIIGAVIAITLGYLSVARERSNRTLSLIRSRPVSGGELATGSMLGALGVLTTLVMATMVVGVLCVGIFGHDWLNGTQALKLSLVCVAAIAYLGAFYCLGAIATAATKVGTNGLMVALGIWLLVVLVLPQIGDTLDADNQVPGGLFTALTLDHDGELAILKHFVGYERTRTWIEDASLTKHFERFAFAMTDVKERYRPYGIGWLAHETRADIAWLGFYAVALFAGLRRSLTRQNTTSQGETS